jgi:hypothetical protein
MCIRDSVGSEMCIRDRVKSDQGISCNEKIKICDELKHVKELWTYSCSNKDGTESRCYWDHHTFDGVGILCPISYNSKQVAKKNSGEGTSFTIKENIPKSKDISALKLNDVTDAYYEVDGVFCSPECCLAFVNDEKTKIGGSKYNDSERLLHSMLGLTSRIYPANSYRLLKEYGGNLTIEQFRKSNKSVKYEYHGTTVLISHLFEKKINLSVE